MNQKQFLERMEEIYAENVAISRAKNSDYAGEGDPFLNFKASEMYGIPVSQAIIVRMSDKLMRASNLLQRPGLVADEKIGDTLQDLANYAVILKIWLESSQTIASRLTELRTPTAPRDHHSA